MSLVVHVAGTGTFAAETIEYAHAAGFEVAALVELFGQPEAGAVAHGLPVIALGDRAPSGGLLVIGAGGERQAHVDLVTTYGWGGVTVVHPAAVVSESALIGPGCLVGPRAVIGAHTQVGEHTLIGRGALIGHHVTIGPAATINPGANIGGNSNVGAGARVGMGAIVVDGSEVGAAAVVAAGAVVVRPVEASTRVQGVPAAVYEPAGR